MSQSWRVKFNDIQFDQKLQYRMAASFTVTNSNNNKTVCDFIIFNDLFETSFL